MNLAMLEKGFPSGDSFKNYLYHWRKTANVYIHQLLEKTGFCLPLQGWSSHLQSVEFNIYHNNPTQRGRLGSFLAHVQADTTQLAQLSCMYYILTVVP